MFVLFYIQLFSYFRCKCVIKRSVQFSSTGLGVVQGHWKWRRLIDHIRLSIGRPL